MPSNTHTPALSAVVSGSFRRAMPEVQRAVADLVDRGALVLSPADPRVVDAFGDFVFVASDEVRLLKTVQGRHLASIAASDFVWLVAPDGYVGQSASMEIGFAAAHEVPVYCTDVPIDLTLRQWVTVVADLDDAIRRHTGARVRRGPDSLLVEPLIAIEAAHEDLVVIEHGLVGRPTPEATNAADCAARRLRHRLLVP